MQTASIVQSQKNSFVKITLAIFVALVLVMLICYVLGIRYNGSPSYPEGFYALTQIKGDPELGRLVFVCPPNTETFKEARRRAYLGPGLCTGSFTPIIKRVVAREGAVVQVLPHGAVFVDGIQQRNSTVYAQDGEGRVLPSYSGGVLERDEYLLLSDYFAGSFDSRYFGPLKREQIIGYAHPVFGR